MSSCKVPLASQHHQHAELTVLRESQWSWLCQQASHAHALQPELDLPADLQGFEAGRSSVVRDGIASLLAALVPSQQIA